ncbi:MAG: PD40 domain-containing protein [Anaerolineales bacterium]|nr:PD40 domain-containing protein [Anaerolineales bacterium]
MTPRIRRHIGRNAGIFLLILLTVFPANLSIAQGAGPYTRVSVNSGGEGANEFSGRGAISANGRFVAFDSSATNLTATDTNGFGDVFLRDLQLGTTVLVSTAATGAQGNEGSGTPVISADGRFVAFESGATNLTSLPDTNGFTDIYVKDMQTGIVTRASLSSTGAEPNNESMVLSISGDGRYVVFDSEADNLVPNDMNGRGDIFVRDMQTNTTIGVTVSGNSGGYDGSISLDGNHVVFNSGSTNFVTDDTNDRADVFVYSMLTGEIVRASVNSSGVQGDWPSIEPSISGDGRYVAFSTRSNYFTTVDTYGYIQLYIRDMQAGVTTLATFQDGYAMVGEADASVISADGRYIAYSFDDKGDGMPRRWIYLHDRLTATNKVVVSPGADEMNPALPSISGDGRYLVFVSSSSNLVPGDTNNTRDVFLKDLQSAPDPNPTVISTMHGCPNGCINAADQFVDFLVAFSEPVTGVDVTDFALSIGGGIIGAGVTTVSGAGSDYIVRVDTGTGDGTIRLDVVDDDSIKDSSMNPLNGGFTSGAVYVVDKSIVVAISIQKLDASPTANNSIRYAVNFSEPVTGVDASDFIFTATGSLAGFSISEVSGAEASYIVTANPGTGEGTLRLDLVDDDSILDAFSIPLGGLGAGNGNFTTGDTYIVDRTPPTAIAILKLDPDPTAAEAVHFSVIFSEPVRYIDVSQFAIKANGPTGVTIPELSINASTAIVTVGTGTGNGTIQLDVVDNDSLFDAVGNPLGGAGAGNGNFAGPFYSISKKTAETKTERLRSNGRNDGWILESNETSNVGGTKNSNADTFRVGDDGQDRQYRSILHFPTHHLPDNAVITQAILMIKVQGVAGTDPFLTHGNLLVDVCSGPYGSWGPFGVNALQASDFQDPAGLSSAAIIQNNPVGGWYWAVMNPAAFLYINKTGVTQIRLAFQLDDNDDLGVDYLTFFSGDAEDQAIRPHLLIDYYVP